MKIHSLSFILCLTLAASGLTVAHAQENEFLELSLEELSNIVIVTPSRKDRTINKAFSNVSVVTQDMIKRRGYRNLIEILEDLPGFDFATYEDGGGEYPVHNLNRGIGGDNGNSRMLVMIDGIVQNHIAFNWAQGLTNEALLQDIDRIEVIHGPGSVLYGTNAVSGIIHIITKNTIQGTEIRGWLGQHNSKTVELLHGQQQQQVSWQLAIKHHHSDGDMGQGRPDPGNYFSKQQQPRQLSQDYRPDANGDWQYLTNVANPAAGQGIPSGFNTRQQDSALRFKLNTQHSNWGVYYWERKDGLGSYTSGFEYQATANDHIAHASALTLYGKYMHPLSDNLVWHSNGWYRLDKQHPDTGFRYLYRFPELKKSYHSRHSQLGLEQQLDITLPSQADLSVGLQLLHNHKMQQVVSLGQTQSLSQTATESSWDLASNGQGLHQYKNYHRYHSNEIALYGLYERPLTHRFSLSAGARYSYSSDFGSTFNPRAGLIYQADNGWIYKTLYGSAFRQPTLFELHDEFRGNPSLKPETIDTLELMASRFFSNPMSSIDSINWKSSLFYSRLSDGIQPIGNPEKYQNIESISVAGLFMQLDAQLNQYWRLYSNYSYTQGKTSMRSWGDIDHSASHKLNLGMNWFWESSNLNINLRANLVGKRKTPTSNLYFDQYAPGYQKFDLVISKSKLFNNKGLSAQLLVNNLFNESYYGVGRQSGNSLSRDYDAASNINPDGFIPAYHPQPGRQLVFNLSYQF